MKLCLLYFTGWKNLHLINSAASVETTDTREETSVCHYFKKNIMCDLENKNVCVLRLVNDLLCQHEREQHL